MRRSKRFTPTKSRPPCCSSCGASPAGAEENVSSNRVVVKRDRDDDGIYYHVTSAESAAAIVAHGFTDHEDAGTATHAPSTYRSTTVTGCSYAATVTRGRAIARTAAWDC